MAMDGTGKMISCLLCEWKISQSQNQCSNLLLARAVKQIVQTLVSAKYFQWDELMYVNFEGFGETLFMIQPMRTMKMIILTTMFRIFDADYQTLCLIASFNGVI